jgi:hypothetical protein
MSNALAIAGVSAVLKDLLDNGLIDHQVTDVLGAGVTVSSLAPDVVPIEGNNLAPRLNLFLHQVTPNAAWRNVDLPSCNASGRRVSNPPLALDLHYLLTAYGIAELEAEVLLGYGMQLLHENPVLSRAAIRTALNPSPVSSALLPTVYQALRSADLAEQVEMLKITPSAMSSEEMSRLWSALTAHYRPTAAFQVSVVLIESRRPARSALPVRQRNLAVRAFNPPVIQKVAPQLVAPGGTLTLSGYNLRGDITVVSLSGTEVTPPNPGSNEIAVTVPPSLRAGANTAQVLHPVDFGTAVEPHKGFESNVLAFMVVPTVSGLPTDVARGASLTFNVSPSVAVEQKATLILNDITMELPPRAPLSAPISSLSFAIPADFPTGPYLLRLRVNGAETALELESDAVEPDPLQKEYVGPKVTVT